MSIINSSCFVICTTSTWPLYDRDETLTARERSCTRPQIRWALLIEPRAIFFSPFSAPASTIGPLREIFSFVSFFFWLYTAVSVLRARRNKTDRRKSLSRGRELDCTTFCSTGNNAGREAITQFSGCGASYGCNYWGQQTCLRFLTKLQNCETRCQFFLFFFFHFCFERQMWSFRGSICETTMQSFISVPLCHRWVFLITMADGLKRTRQITLLNVKQTLDENKHCKKITPQTIVVARTTEQKKTD